MKDYKIKIDEKMYLKDIEIVQDEKSLTGIRIRFMCFSEFGYELFGDYSLACDIEKTLYVNYGIISKIEVAE